MEPYGGNADITDLIARVLQFHCAIMPAGLAKTGPQAGHDPNGDAFLARGGLGHGLGQAGDELVQALLDARKAIFDALGAGGHRRLGLGTEFRVAGTEQPNAVTLL